MSKKPIYRLRSLQADSEGAVYCDNDNKTGYGFHEPSRANQRLNVVEINIPDLLDDGDVVVIRYRITDDSGYGYCYLDCTHQDTKHGVLRSLESRF